MRRVLLITPLLVALVACGGNSTQPANGSGLSTLTPAEVSSKMARDGLCKAKPVFTNEERTLWLCTRGNNPNDLGIAIYQERQQFLDDLEADCVKGETRFKNAWAFGANWAAPDLPTGPDAVNANKVAKTLGGAVAVDFSDLCKKLGLQSSFS